MLNMALSMINDPETSSIKESILVITQALLQISNMLHMYFTGDNSRAIPKLKEDTRNERVLCGVSSPCFAFKEILKEIVKPIV